MARLCLMKKKFESSKKQYLILRIAQLQQVCEKYSGCERKTWWA